MESTMGKKFVIIVLVIGVLAVGAILVSGYLKDKTPEATNTANTNQDQQPIVQKTDVDFSKNPDRFPSNVPIETGAKITQNYNATTPDGVFQATRVFETKATLDANLKLYSDWLKSNGWTIQATVNESSLKVVQGAKGNQKLQISIDQNTVTDIKTVSIIYTEAKK